MRRLVYEGTCLVELSVHNVRINDEDTYKATFRKSRSLAPAGVGSVERMDLLVRVEVRRSRPIPARGP